MTHATVTYAPTRDEARSTALAEIAAIFHAEPNRTTADELRELVGPIPPGFAGFAVLLAHMEALEGVRS